MPDLTQAEREAAVEAILNVVRGGYSTCDCDYDSGPYLVACNLHDEEALVAAARAVGRAEVDEALRELMTAVCSRCGWDFYGLSSANLALWRQENNEGCACTKARALFREPSEGSG